MWPNIFKTLSSLVSLYTLLCFIRIMLTWFPNSHQSQVVYVLSRICDPYLNIFRKIPLRISAFDFSPAIALCVLWGLSYILQSLQTGIIPSVGAILALIISLVWNVFSSLLGFLMILIIIRLIVILFSKNYSSYGSIWDQIDRALSPILYGATKFFAGKRIMPYKTVLIIALGELLLIQFLGRYLIWTLCGLLNSIPF